MIYLSFDAPDGMTWWWSTSGPTTDQARRVEISDDDGSLLGSAYRLISAMHTPGNLNCYAHDCATGAPVARVEWNAAGVGRVYRNEADDV